MNVLTLYDDTNVEMDEIVQILIKENDKRINNGNSNVNFFMNKIPRRKINLYIIFSNDIKEINILKEDSDIKNMEKLLILTSNLNSEFILKCIDITPYIYYVKNKTDDVLEKIIKISNLKV
jgi:DNA-binding NarL/FixJ family response regulator